MPVRHADVVAASYPNKPIGRFGSEYAPAGSLRTHRHKLLRNGPAAWRCEHSLQLHTIPHMCQCIPASFYLLKACYERTRRLRRGYKKERSRTMLGDSVSDSSN